MTGKRINLKNFGEFIGGLLFLLGKKNYMRYYRIRKLTPRECGRLMGVDDTDINHMLSYDLKDSELHKMYGNSIVCDCMIHMFDNLFLNRPMKKDIELW